MNRKNTILIAVMVNAGLLAVLLVAALTTQEEIPSSGSFAMETPTTLPKFDDVPLFADLNPLPFETNAKAIEMPVEVATPEPVLHSLPPLVPESLPIVSAPPPPQPSAPPLPTFSNQVVVKKGDSLDKIAKANRTSVDELVKFNQLSSTFLKIGQVLKIPAEKAAKAVKAPEKKETGPEYYTMKVGDNPWAIAMKHHMKVEELLRLNGLNEERARKLKPGDRLRIR